MHNLRFFSVKLAYCDNQVLYSLKVQVYGSGFKLKHCSENIYAKLFLGS